MAQFDSGRESALQDVMKEVEGMKKSCNNEICQDPECLLRTYNTALNDTIAVVEKML